MEIVGTGPVVPTVNIKTTESHVVPRPLRNGLRTAHPSPNGPATPLPHVPQGPSSTSTRSISLLICTKLDRSRTPIFPSSTGVYDPPRFGTSGTYSVTLQYRKVEVRKRVVSDTGESSSCSFHVLNASVSESRRGHVRPWTITDGGMKRRIQGKDPVGCVSGRILPPVKDK